MKEIKARRVELQKEPSEKVSKFLIELLSSEIALRKKKLKGRIRKTMKKVVEN
jgi:hypothetical protein